MGKIYISFEIKLLLTFLIIFSFFIQWIWWASNTNLDLIRAIVDENRFEIDSYYNNTGDRSFYHGHYYSDKLPGMSFLTLWVYSVWKTLDYNPSYNFTTHVYSSKYGSTIIVNDLYPSFSFTMLQFFLVFFSSSIFSALTVLVLYRLLKFFVNDGRVITFTAVIYGLATISFAYSTVFYYHALQSFFMIFSFYLIYSYLKSRKEELLLASGIIVGFSLSFSLTSLVASIFLFFIIFKVKKLKPVFLFFIGFITGALPLPIYNYLILGNPIDTTYNHMDPVIWPHLVEYNGFKFPPSPFIILRLLIDPYRGLLFYSPVLIFSFLGIIWLIKRYLGETFLILTIFFSLLIINASWWAWEGGTSYGARHLLPAISFLMIPLSFSLIKFSWKIILPFFLVSLFFNIIGLGPWEWIGKPYTVRLPTEIEDKAANSLDIIGIPLITHYLPHFLENGPRSLIMESLIIRDFNIRQEMMVLRKNPAPFITILPLISVIAIIWWREIYLLMYHFLGKSKKMNEKVRKYSIFRIFLTFLLIFIYFSQVVGWGEYSKIDLTRAIVDENRFEIDSFYNNTGDRSFYNGHYYSDKAPGASLFGTSIYSVWKKICISFFFSSCIPSDIKYIENKIVVLDGKNVSTYEAINPGNLYLGTLFFLTLVLSSLPSALTVLLVYKISKLFLKKETQRILITLTYGLGTLAFIYGTIFFTHSLATFLIFLSFYLILKYKASEKRFLIISGLIADLAAVVDYPVILISILLFFYTLSFKKIKFSFLFLTFFLIGLLPLLLYNFTILGTPFKLVYTYTDPAIRKDVGESMGFKSLPNLFIIYRHLFDPYRGIFFYHPILLLSIIGLYYMFKKYKYEALLILLIFIDFLLAFSMRDINFFDFGSSFGARNYLPIIPFLMIPLCFALQNFNFIIFKILLIVSIFNNIIGLQNWEQVIGEANSVYIAEPYRSKVNSFEILYNPIKDYYFPLFLKNGPRARIVENILDGRSIFEIRHFFDTQNNHPFITILPLVFLILLIWRNHISFKSIVGIIMKNQEIIFVPAIMILLLI